MSKIGSGFNFPRVLSGCTRPDWRSRYALARRMVRMPRERFPRRIRWWPVGSSVTAVLEKLTK